MVETDIPLLNKYKKQFVLRRLSRTYFGGARFHLGYALPAYVYLCQIVMWLLPLAVGSVFTLSVEVGHLDPLYASIADGLVFGILALTVQVLSKLAEKASDVHFSHRGSRPNGSNSQTYGTLFGEEDEFNFRSCCTKSTYLFIVPPKRHWRTIFITSTLSSFMNGIGLWYSLPYSTITVVHGYDMTASVLMFIFSWITICIAHYALLIGDPIPETAAYHTVDLYETQNISRTLHVCLFFIVFLVSAKAESSILTIANAVLHIVFCVLPALWLLGIIPPFDCLVIWFMEQFLVFVLGGSSMSTHSRLFFMVVCSSTALIGLSFTASSQVLLSACAGLGYLLSTNLVASLYDAAAKVVSYKWTQNKVVDFKMRDIHSTSGRDVFKKKAIIFHCVMFTFSFALSFLPHHYSSAAAKKVSLKAGFGYTFIVLFVVSFTCKELQRVYILGVFHSWFYPRTILAPIQYDSRKKMLRLFGYTHFAVLRLLFPLLSTTYLSFYILQGSSQQLLPSLEATMGCIHGFRFIWQRPGNALISLVALSILNLVPGLKSALGVFLEGTRLIIIDACRDRIFQFFENFWFASTLLITAWTDHKQRICATLPIIILNVVFFPILLLVILTTSMLSSPLLPLFTLPLFLIGFPRWKKFWPSLSGSVCTNVCSDTVYYKGSVYPVSSWLSSEIALGIMDTSLSSCCDSPFYIVRSQNKTFWIQILESGYTYACFSIKGLELQGTSCHSLEATRLDDGFDAAFESVQLNSHCFRTNPYAGSSSVTALDSALICCHSDTKNSLLGIVDHPDNIIQLRKDFLKSMAWVLCHYIFSHESSFTSQEKSIIKIQSVQPDSTQTIHKTVYEKIEDEQESNSASMADSFVSFTSILSFDKDIENNRSTKKFCFHEDIELKNKHPHGKDQQHFKRKFETAVRDDLGSVSSDTGFGLPATDCEIRTERIPTNSHQLSALERTHIVCGTESQHAEMFIHRLIPEEWSCQPISDCDMNRSKSILDIEWLEHCIIVAKMHPIEEDVMPGLLSSLTKLISSCDATVNIMGVPGKDATTLGKDHIKRVFAEDIPWSPALDWLKERTTLHRIVLKSYRYAVKLMYDQASLGTAESFEELTQYLAEYDREWYIGAESDPEWQFHVLEGTSNLFALLCNSTNNLSVRVLKKQDIPFYLARVNTAAVKGISANFALEMIYETNDDEERYSIQAHTSLMRNFIIQASDPPLGYPVFLSQPLTVCTLPFA